MTWASSARHFHYFHINSFDFWCQNQGARRQRPRFGQKMQLWHQNLTFSTSNISFEYKSPDDLRSRRPNMFEIQFHIGKCPWPLLYSMYRFRRSETHAPTFDFVPRILWKIVLGGLLGTLGEVLVLFGRFLDLFVFSGLGICNCNRYVFGGDGELLGRIPKVELGVSKWKDGSLKAVG